MNELVTPGAGDLIPAQIAARTLPVVPAGADARLATLVYAPTTVYNTTIHAHVPAPPPPAAPVRVLAQPAAPAAPVASGARRYALAEVVVWAGACLLGGGAVDAGLTGFLYA